ncbi:MAG: LysR family transcriptional regulator [Desulfobacteraceae bacterium]|nr:LysR family transcriptional regulator [Desulfobacteraceae bacterium]
MDLGSLRIFYVTGVEGSVSKASLKLNCVQSNVTARIKQLEDELDVQLFYRKKRGMALTPSGKILMGYAKKALVLFKDAKKAVQQTDTLKGPLNIGSLDSTAAARLPCILTRFHQEYPEVDLTIQTGTDEKLRTMIAEYQLDAAFVEASAKNNALDQIPVFNEELVVVANKNVDPPGSMKHPTLIVFPTGCTYRRILENWFFKKGVHDFKIMEFGSHEGILGCVSSGLGVTLFPVSLLNQLNYYDKLKVYRLPKKIGNLGIHWIQRKDVVTTRAMTEFLRIVNEETSINTT